ncbi:transcription initiation factor TFIID subunit 4-like isoform X1 [Solea senegalensis]|uniref:Transcription initiation factor TFIID subunit 4-like isoform X1 n=1 Tax=Solea senegalensis TaxID=28829 RepID=A0AAV6Q527_SOLSE|nr:transcription initiation factor TFIID subunit 4-like isoform X1 [Solea senegalensis]KAG7483486.1 transcription initiation factor TFIID subunit 4-like isoform X1 [Solea senegalensis]
MAGASDPLEDMLFSDVDEKAVSDLVGSLESELAGQSNPSGKTDENGGAGSVAPANHLLGKTLPAPVGTTTLEQQQQGRRNKPEIHQEITSKDPNPDKAVTPHSLGCSPSFGEPSTTSAASVNAASHGASITTLAAPGMSTLASPAASISTTCSRGFKTSLGSGETSTEANPARKRINTPRRTASARIKSFNGASVTTRRNSNTGVPETPASVDPSVTTPNSTSATSSINTSTFTVSNASLPVGQSAIALDRGTPTIALHRLPRHIVASITQNGTGTSVSALVQQGARVGPTTSPGPQENHSKPVTDTGASRTDDCQSQIGMSIQSDTVYSVINSVASTPSVVTPPPTTTTAAAPTTTTITQPLSSATATACVTAVSTTSVCGQSTSVTTTVSMVRPPAPSPTPAVATSAQSQPRPGLTAPQRIVAPQLIVRPPQQQTTIQLPPGFTIPPGMVLVRTELGQLVMVPQQALAQVQAQAQAQAQAQNSISPRPATPTTGTSFKVTTPQSPVTSQTTRQCSLTPAKMVPSPSPTPSSPALQTSSSSSSSSSSSCPALRPKGPVAPAIAVTAPQQTPVVMAPQTPAQAASQPVQPAQTGIAASPAASIVSQEMQENVKKCKNFLATLIKLASHNSPSPETSKNVKALVQDLLDAKIEPEEFTSRLQAELKSSPQPYLVPFLKKSLPALRLSLLNSQHSLTPQQGVKPAPGGVPPAIVTGPAVHIRHTNSVSTTPGASVLPTGTHGHAAAMGVKTASAVGGQVRMPVVITQSVRTQGIMGKGAVIQAGKSPMGLAVQVSGNQKNKLNDPGGGSFRDDDDINDVASMAGVNLNEESARILATNSDLVGTHIRSCKDEAFLHPGLLHRRILEAAKKFGVTEVPMEAVTFISHATQSRLRTVVEKVSSVAQHRLDSCKDDECYEQAADVRSQLRFFEQLERIEKQRKDEEEREILLKAAKSRSRQEDPEQARLKQKAKEMQQQELAQMRQRDANLTALAAIGPRKKRKVDSPGTTPSGTEVSGSSAGSPASSSVPSTSSRQYTRQRITRVNLRDLIFYMEQERETAHSLLLYRALLK